MAFTNTNDFLTGRKPIPTSDCLELIATRFTLTLTAADLALNTIGAIGVLPAGSIPVALYVDSTDVDSGSAALILQVGVLDATSAAFSTATADGGAVWGETVASASAFQQQILSQPMVSVSAIQADRNIGVKVKVAPTAALPGTLGLTLLYYSA